MLGGDASSSNARLPPVTRPVLPDSPDLLHRILLATDGTVTSVLEAYAEEPVRATMLAQFVQPSRSRDAALLAVPEGAPVLNRKVLLCGERSGRTFLYGQSLILVERLDRRIADGLVLTNKPIGILLRESRIETFREILTAGQERAGACAAYFQAAEDATLLFRTYRIEARGRPIMLVTERFPRSRDEGG